MKKNNKVLLIVLLALLAAFILTRVFRAPARESNLDKEIFHVDTTDIFRLEIQAAGTEAPLKLTRSDSGWQVQEGQKTAMTDRSQVKSLLRTLATVEPERIVSRTEKKWNQYQVGDSATLRLTAFNRDGGEVAAWRIGKEQRGSTFIRPASEEEVYAIDGNLRTRFNKDFNDWRDKTFLRVKRNLIDKIAFRYPADSGFVLEKKSGAWRVGRQKADSLKVAQYLAKIQSKDLRSFADEYAPAQNPDVTLTIEGNGTETTISGWKKSGRQWILSSSLQEGVYFSDSTFTADLFPGKQALIDSN